ncbi:MAG TPA: hypothetical protein VGX25_14275 [Actinophytocola sp.]|uniref:hypothetical protein n=1 Tax=Actinophytocola sp. TaxID=1872138 RepID=UPI002DDD73EE|nr:hypothetical protein [Actinophytocola sp.]HEV2780553.1 hypothetical protein [Actinophytocola sp.]
MHTEDLATAAGRNQPTDRDERWDEPDRPDIPESRKQRETAESTAWSDGQARDRRDDEGRVDEPDEPMARPVEELEDRPAEEELDVRSEEFGTRRDEFGARSDQDEFRSADARSRPDEDGTRPDEAQNRPDEAEIRPAGGEVRAEEQMAPSGEGEDTVRLFRPEDVERFRSEWQQVQVRFVDDPRDAVENADHLVAEVMQTLATTFNEHKQELEGQWRQGSGVQTEELRLALRRYRAFFNQLLNA